MAKATVKNIEAALAEMRGNITAVSRKLGVSRMTIYRKIEKSKRLQEALHESRETMLDEAENKLYEKAIAGSTPELLFFLKTQGKSRGYIERQEHDLNPDDKVIRVSVGNDE